MNWLRKSLPASRPSGSRPCSIELSFERLEDRVVLNWNPGSFPQHLIDIGNVQFYTVRDGVHGRELWRSNGTAAGTVLVKDINPPKGLSPEALDAYFLKLDFNKLV
jgi:ELWxxDGT repeat protein